MDSRLNSDRLVEEVLKQAIEKKRQACIDRMGQIGSSIGKIMNERKKLRRAGRNGNCEYKKRKTDFTNLTLL